MRFRVAGDGIKNIASMVLLLLLLTSVGCGYHLYTQGEIIDREIQKVYVAVFTNNTSEANIESGFRNAFIDQFIKGRRFKAVDNEGSADAILRGDIKNLVISPLAYRGSNNLAVEKRITVTLSLALEKRGALMAVWRDDNFSQWGDYATDGQNLNMALAGQRNALTRLANDVAERAYRIMTSDF